MEHAMLSSLITALEKGNKMHITIAFLNHCGNRKTKCAYNQTVHDRPVCCTIKKTPEGMAGCARCRNLVQKAVTRHRKTIAGFCVNGVYEYCRPVIYNDKVICVIYIGNILTNSEKQRNRLLGRVSEELLETMDPSFTPEDCAATADILESYICLLFDRYGIESETFDPLTENIKTYIRENLTYEISMTELAAAFNYTPKYLGRLFKARTGESIHHYRNRLKVNQAKTMLTETNLSVEQIAAETGFNSLTYFDRVFCKMTGVSPNEYRSGKKDPAL